MTKNTSVTFKRLAVCAFMALMGGMALEAQAAPCFASLPLANMTITSHYGNRWSPTAKARRPHWGIDLRARIGTDVFAVHDGKVFDFGQGGDRGVFVDIKGDDGIISSYYHNSLVIVKQERGVRVKAGQLIAKSGDTSSYDIDPHLHFVTAINGSLAKGNRVDPLNFLCPGTFPKAPNSGPSPWQKGDQAMPAYQANAATGAAAATTGTPGTPATSTTPAIPATPGTPATTASIPEGSPPGTQPPALIPPNIVGLVSPPMQTFPSMDDKSIRDFLVNETHKRFLSQQWYLELIDPAAALRRDPENAGKTFDSSNMDPKIYMLRELNIIMALDNLMATERYTSRENIEARMAALLSLDAKNYSDKVLSMLRSLATTSK